MPKQLHKFEGSPVLLLSDLEPNTFLTNNTYIALITQDKMIPFSVTFRGWTKPAVLGKKVPYLLDVDKIKTLKFSLLNLNSIKLARTANNFELPT